MTVDPALVTRKMVSIATDLDELRLMAEHGVDTYLQDKIGQAAAERYLERAIGRMIDINYHLITETGHPPPPDYHASFTRLGEIGVLEPALAQRIARAAGLRNRLVHEYDVIDPHRVFEGLEAALRDLPLYLARVQAFISERERGR